MRAGEEYDKDVVTKYYTNFVPTYKPFEELAFSLGKMLEEDFFPQKGYKFVFHLVTVTVNFDIALVYLQTNSLNALMNKYTGEIDLIFKN